MAQENPNRLVEWLHAIRAHAPTVRQGFANWWEAVREEPVLIWETPAVRYGAYGLGGVITIWLASAGITMFTPPAPEGAKSEATSADFHVICSNSTCQTHFVVHREFGFRGFPVACPKCKEQKGLQAVPCTGDHCTQRWILPDPAP